MSSMSMSLVLVLGGLEVWDCILFFHFFSFHLLAHISASSISLVSPTPCVHCYQVPTMCLPFLYPPNAVYGKDQLPEFSGVVSAHCNYLESTLAGTAKVLHWRAGWSQDHCRLLDGRHGHRCGHRPVLAPSMESRISGCVSSPPWLPGRRAQSPVWSQVHWGPFNGG